VFLFEARTHPAVIFEPEFGPYGQVNNDSGSGSKINTPVPIPTWLRHPKMSYGKHFVAKHGYNFV
jgi:hypothetical protein